MALPQTSSDAPWLRTAAPLGALTLLMLMPVTLPVPVLKELVQERFDVTQFQTSLFMSINMVGALLAAPLAGLADRFGRHRALVVGALLVDAGCFWAMTQPVSFAAFMAIRFLEGCAHILALSLVLAVASAAAGEARRGRVMGLVGGGIMLGVAIGAPLGGVLGRTDALLPLRVGGGLVIAAALISVVALRGTHQRDGEARPGPAAIVAALRGNAALIAPLLFAFADRFTVGFFTTTFSLYLRTIHELPQPRIGMLIAAFMLPFALLSPVFGWVSERYSRVAMLCGGSALYGIGTLTLVSWSPDALPWLMAGLGVTAAVMFVPSMIMTTELAPPEIRSTAMGAFNAAGSLGFIIGPATGGFVSQTVAAGSGWEAGYAAAFGVAGVSEIVCVIVALPFLLRLVRQQRTT